jgi:hypothetical protein
MSKLVAIAASLYFVTLAYFGFVPAASAHSLNYSLNSAIATPMALFSFAGTRPANIGVTNGKLLDCPDSPNCVSSQSNDAEHKIAPLTYTGDPAKALEDLYYPDVHDIVIELISMVGKSPANYGDIPHKESMTDFYKHFKGPF